MRVGPHRWSHTYCPVRRYRGMTSNILEYMNNCLWFCKNKIGYFCTDFFKIRTWLESYSGVIFPVGHLSEKTCSCREFQNDLLPYCQALIALRFCKNKIGYFCTDFFKIRTWLESYSGVIFPVGHLSEWNTSEEVHFEVVLPPAWRPQAGRPRKNRVPSADEYGRRTRYYTICKKSGHNKQNCPNPSANHQSNILDLQTDPSPHRCRK
ncbi:hypothetical protein Dsin_013500 [Dipteronia sinensis]|uniref:SWIM-type domain-containing protein n=1 Tax=Dipteronia sinensis TaxID=43782 RepID=A0AAE0AKV7_9ROSI|nr:hypothetical protein Dsin_013500 [Dipteronia sinensis]